MRIRIQLITLMRIRILLFNLMRIHADPVSDPQHFTDTGTSVCTMTFLFPYLKNLFIFLHRGSSWEPLRRSRRRRHIRRRGRQPSFGNAHVETIRYDNITVRRYDVIVHYNDVTCRHDVILLRTGCHLYHSVYHIIRIRPSAPTGRGSIAGLCDIKRILSGGRNGRGPGARGHEKRTGYSP